MQNGYIESFNGRMRDEILNESLFFGFAHARSAISEWLDDYNTAKPHSLLDYQTPAAYARIITATGSDATLIKGSASSPVVQPAPYDVTEMAKALGRVDKSEPEPDCREKDEGGEALDELVVTCGDAA